MAPIHCWRPVNRRSQAVALRRLLANCSCRLEKVVAEKLHSWVVLQRRMKRNIQSALANCHCLRRFSRFAAPCKRLQFLNTLKIRFEFILFQSIVCYQGFLLVVLRQPCMCICVLPMSGLIRLICSAEKFTLYNVPRRYFYLIEFLNETQFVEIETKQLRLCASDSISDISSIRMFSLLYVLVETFSDHCR
ncbi:Ribosomal RNA small subunit methyltransferase [Trichinella pseudospiralis]